MKHPTNTGQPSRLVGTNMMNMDTSTAATTGSGMPSHFYPGRLLTAHIYEKNANVAGTAMAAM